MGRMKLTAFSAIVILIIASMLPLGTLPSPACIKTPFGHQNMRAGISPRTLGPKQNGHSIPIVPQKARAGGKIPFCSNFVFQSDIMRNLLEIRSGERRRKSGIHQIFLRNALENGNRLIIHDIIVKNPGIDQAGIATKTGLDNQTLRYHLGVLISFHKVTARREGVVICFFENREVLTEQEKQLDIHMRSLTTRNILELIDKNPGIKQVTIANTLNITAAAVIWHIRKLTRDGLVQEESRGRTVHYTITPEGAEVYVKFVEQVSAANLSSSHHTSIGT